MVDTTAVMRVNPFSGTKEADTLSAIRQLQEAGVGPYSLAHELNRLLPHDAKETDRIRVEAGQLQGQALETWSAAFFDHLRELAGSAEGMQRGAALLSQFNSILDRWQNVAAAEDSDRASYDKGNKRLIFYCPGDPGEASALFETTARGQTENSPVEYVTIRANEFDLSLLASLPTLKFIDLSANRITGQMPTLSSLERVTFEPLNQREGIEFKGPCRKELNLSHCPNLISANVYAGNCEAVRIPAGLKKLKLENASAMTSLDSIIVGRDQTLENLSMIGSGLQGVVALGRFSRTLQSLSLGGEHITGLSGLKELPLLSSLHIKDCPNFSGKLDLTPHAKPTDVAVEEAPLLTSIHLNATQLSWFKIERTGITEVTLYGSASKLKTAEFQRSPLQSLTSISGLDTATALVSLDLSYTGIPLTEILLEHWPDTMRDQSIHVSGLPIGWDTSMTMAAFSTALKKLFPRLRGGPWEMLEAITKEETGAEASNL